MSKAFEVRQAAVIGAGTMGRGIVMSLANAGIQVLWLDNNPQMLEQAMKVVAETNAHNLKLGRISAEQSAARLACVTPVGDYAALADADLVIEAVYENLELKQQIFRTLDATLKPCAILASNTSALDIDAIAAVTARPQDVLGLHFFSPAHIMKLLEIVRGAKTAPAVLDAALALGQRIGKVSVVAGNCDGFIGNRMLHTYVREARELAGKGQDDPAVQVDNRLCGLGRFGQKVRMGYYRYAEGSRQAEHDPEVDALVLQVSEQLGFTRRDIDPSEILERCLLALVNEGAKILEENIAANSHDIDLVYLNGYGFPADKGGPMNWADGQGVAAIHDRLKALQAAFGEHWLPARLIEKLASSGQRFADVRVSDVQEGRV